jgi:hypothetical protein
MLFLRLYLVLYLWFCLSEHSAALITCCLFILQLSLFLDVPRSHFSWNQGMGLGTGGRVIMYYRLLITAKGTTNIKWTIISSPLDSFRTF